MKLWVGRLTGILDAYADKFNSSIGVDQRMVEEDIQGSIAHVTMLGEQGILSQDDTEQIIQGLCAIQQDLASGDLVINEEAEDIHTFIEDELTKRIGEAGKRMHTARSRNDQVVTDFRLNLRKEVDEIFGLLDGYLHALCDLAANHTKTLMPGYTHLQAAQPVSFGYHMMAYAMMALRDKDRLLDVRKRINQSPLGAAALAGTSFPIDRNRTADLLGFEGAMQNAMDAVSDRDFVIELESTLAILGMHLSRQAEELIIWSSQPYQFVQIADAYVTGSSIMPQKRNPDMAELIRGKSATLYGSLIQGLTMMKGLPLAYAKDTQEDKESAFRAVDTVKDCLILMTGMLEGLVVNKDALYKACKLGYLNATDLADYLVTKGLPFRDAHHVSGELVALCVEKDCGLEDLSLADFQAKSELIEEDVFEAIDLYNILESKTSLGGPAPAEVERQIAWVKGEIV